MREKTCENCYYWNSGGGSGPGKGTCNAAPPTVHMLPTAGGHVTLWPETAPTGWCGHWRDEERRTLSNRELADIRAQAYQEQP